MLITFEGQDGSGKTSLLRATYTALTRLGVPAITVDEFSDSPYGQRLLETLARDKFLRPVLGEPATARIRALEIVSDLYYLDERVITPAIQAGYVVLKDRHLDTVFFTQAQFLMQASERSPTRAMRWLSGLLSELRSPPAATVYVDAPLGVRLARIRKRPDRFGEDRAHQVSQEDLDVFAAREQIIRQLIAGAPARFLVVDNSRPLSEGVTQVLDLVRTWHSGAS
ncbi:dTMP kinase [Actinophytocola sp.]|uniref:dTMP kinase n=1 Tax=Actinophytocola sp. TaxID=1872138 RepID=UPI003D6BD8E3